MELLIENQQSLLRWKRENEVRNGGRNFLLGRGKYRQIVWATISIYHFFRGCVVVVVCGCFCIFSDPWENGKLGKLLNWFAAAPPSSRLYNFQGSIIISSTGGGLFTIDGKNWVKCWVCYWTEGQGMKVAAHVPSTGTNWFTTTINEMIHHIRSYTCWMISIFVLIIQDRFSMIPLADESGAIFSKL